ncbi:MAG: hypothetical protein HYY79_04000 [Betaproteobacteria bacterium]|nr:hypothetical protein [Betaproteobacteria bacterium]
MATYMRHLKPGGVLIFQATNRFVDITHVVARLALEYGLTAVLVSDIPDAQRTPHDYWLSSTDQILVTRNRAFLDHPLIGDAAEPLTPRPDFPVWTDDFHNLLRVLK